MQSERRLEGGPLRSRQSLHARPDRTEELMESRERQVSLGLHTRRAHNRETPVARARRRLRKQARLSHPRLAADNKRTARAFDSVEERGEHPYLVGSTDQPSEVARLGRHFEDNPILPLQTFEVGRDSAGMKPRRGMPG
jgi:hypothetical protein